VKYERFEDLPVWKSAIDLADRVYQLTRDRSFAQPGNLLDQLRRAALSVSNNIAEGFERGTTAELLMFLYIARGSAGEVRSMLLFADRRPELSHLKSEISNLKSLAESCSRQLRAWADNLQNSDIRGQRHLNADSRKDFELKRGSDALWTRLEEEQRRRVAEWSQSTNARPEPPPEP
jgi:four helix bundle protein